ncbi:hypothetical protein STA1M1_18860 [Sinisalibacter aestuarii]|uniref:Uncharacterized protein n=1 Tax=Sinisalibacter aestuarii TaxID=2949426 RepID=A0ABQ5LSQ3_9RHOB|nr:hypothetical protein STA1M1_18860 [Sinisalibacter aestuarii]
MMRSLPNRLARATSPGGARPSPREGALATSRGAHPSSGAFEINYPAQPLRSAHPGSGAALGSQEVMS